MERNHIALKSFNAIIIKFELPPAEGANKHKSA
jgi:hypothetical protein